MTKGFTREEAFELLKLNIKFQQKSMLLDQKAVLDALGYDDSFDEDDDDFSPF